MTKNKIRNPALFLTFGYLLYVVIGWLALCFPLMQQEKIGALDNLFMATSAVSTTGLVTVDTGSVYTFWGQLVILMLIQLGGIGYMTFGSFIVMSIRRKLTTARMEATKSTFALPKNFSPLRFVRSVVIFTLICEAVGAVSLYILFVIDGQIDKPMWNAIFHSVSAFCTAGFSLFPDSFESFKFNPYVNLVIAALSYLGAMGFLVMSDVWRVSRDKKTNLYFTTKIILKITLTFAIIGTCLFYALEPSIQGYEPWQRLLTSFFQIMTAATTVGFNTIPIGALAPSIVLFLCFLMIFGASPSGTGGGLKSTTLAILGALIRSVLRRRSSVRLRKREISADTLNLATASFVFYMMVLLVAVTLLLALQPLGLETGHTFEVILFEAISALGTVGLSMGITGNLAPLSKLIIILLMFMGRVGILNFGLAISMRDETRREEKDNEVLL